MDKVDTLLDAALQALVRRLKQRLLLLGDIAEDVERLLSTIGLHFLLADSKALFH